MAGNAGEKKEEATDLGRVAVRVVCVPYFLPCVFVSLWLCEKRLQLSVQMRAPQTNVSWVCGAMVVIVWTV